MKIIKLSDIEKMNKKPEIIVKDKKISSYVKSQKEYKAGRTRPKSPVEAKILDRFSRKK